MPSFHLFCLPLCPLPIPLSRPDDDVATVRPGQAYLTKLRQFIQDSSPSFERLDEEELLAIVPFVQYRTVERNSVIVAKVGRC